MNIAPPRRFDVDEFKANLRIDKHALDDMHQAQPELLFEVSEKLTLAISRRDAAKTALAQAEAQADAEIRENARTSEEKITEKSIEAQIKLDGDVIKAQRTLIDLNQEVGILFGLKEAFVDRRNALDSITKLFLSNYFDRLPSRGDRELRGNQASEAQSAQSRQRQRFVSQRDRPSR